MIIKLVLLTTIFLPGWTKDKPELAITLGNSHSVMTSMSQCEEQIVAIKDATGIYQKYYPFTDEYHIAVTADCVRVEEAAPTNF